MNTTIHFYRGNILVRTEICSNEFEAEEIVRRERDMYDYVVFVSGDKDAIR